MVKFEEGRAKVLRQEEVESGKELLNLIVERTEKEIVEITKIKEWNEGLIRSKENMITAINKYLND